MTEITTYEPTTELNLPAVNNTGTALIMRAVEQMAGAHQLAQAMATTAFVPAHFRGKPDDVAAAIMYGAAIGLDPMASLRAIYVVNGNPGMYARQMVAIVQNAGHQIWTEESTDESVTVAGQRRGSDNVERVTWTIARARKAGYTSNKKYETDPQAMLWARAASDVARRMAPDALAGLDTSVEELQVINHVDVTSARPRRESAASLLTQAAPDVEQAAREQADAEANTREPSDAEANTREPDEAPAEAEPLATQKQLTAIRAGLGERGVEDRAKVLAVVAEMVGRDISSSKELTRAEAGLVIDTLAEPVEYAAEDPEPAES